MTWFFRILIMLMIIPLSNDHNKVFIALDEIFIIFIISDNYLFLLKKLFIF